MYLPTLIVLIIVFAITALLVCKRIPKIKELSLSIAFSILFFVVFFIGNIVGAVNQRDRGFGVHSGFGGVNGLYLQLPSNKRHLPR